MSLHILSILFILLQSISASDEPCSNSPKSKQGHDVKNEFVQFTSIPLEKKDILFGNFPANSRDYIYPQDGIEFKFFTHTKMKTNPDQTIEDEKKGTYSFILETDIYFFITKKNNSKPNETSLLFEFETFSIYENQLISYQKLKTTRVTFEWDTKNQIKFDPTYHDHTDLNLDRLFSYPFMLLKSNNDLNLVLSFAPQKDDLTTKLKTGWHKYNAPTDELLDHKNFLNSYCLFIDNLDFKAKIKQFPISFSLLEYKHNVFDQRYPLTEDLKKQELQFKLSKLEEEYGHLKVEALPSPKPAPNGQNEIIKHEDTNITDLTDELRKNIDLFFEYKTLFVEKGDFEISNKKKDDELTTKEQLIQTLKTDYAAKESSYNALTQYYNNLNKSNENLKKEKMALEAKLKNANKKISQLTDHEHEENTKDFEKSTKKDAMELETLRSKVKSLEKEKRIAVGLVIVAVVCLVLVGAGWFFVVSSYKKKKKLNEIRARGLQGHPGNIENRLR